MKITQAQAKFGTVLLALLGALLVVGMVGPATAQVTNQSNDIGEFEQLNVSVDYSGSTTSTISVTNSTGTEVVNRSVSPTTSAANVSETINIEQGSYNVSVSSVDETQVNGYTVAVESSTSIYSSDTVEVSDSDNKIVADVEFSGNTSAHVLIKDDIGTIVDSPRIDVSGMTSNYSWETVEYSPAESGNYSVEVLAENKSQINQTTVSTSSSSAFGSLIGGASSQSMIGFVLVAGSLLYAYREDYL